MDTAIVNNAGALHGHLAPGVALGLRMSEIALSKLGLPKGSKMLFAVCETNRCLPDAIQAATGCTLGHNSIIIENYGKLALTIVNGVTKKGIRVALNISAQTYSELMAAWMMRLSKLSKQDEHELSMQLLELDEKYCTIQNVTINIERPGMENDSIVKCSKCNECFPSSYGVISGSNVYCRACSKTSYYATE